MKKSFFIIIVALIMSATVAFGQSSDNLNSLPERDYVFITFTNMGNLPATGNIHVQWKHPLQWTTENFPYTDAVNNKGSQRYDSQYFLVHNWIKIIVTVSFSDGTGLVKMKTCPYCDHFDFDGSEFTIGATTTPNIIEPD